jgi:predicted RNA-binding protein with PUA domain
MKAPQEYLKCLKQAKIPYEETIQPILVMGFKFKHLSFFTLKLNWQLL